MSLDNPENGHDWKLFWQRELSAIHNRIGGVDTKVAGIERGLTDLIADIKGNGQPGRLTQLEERLDGVESKADKNRGLIVGCSAVLCIIMFALLKIFG